jgi:hypothetical protein
VAAVGVSRWLVVFPTETRVDWTPAYRAARAADDVVESFVWRAAAAAAWLKGAEFDAGEREYIRTVVMGGK